VYSIDVCVNTSLAACKAADDVKWVPLHEWVNAEQEEDDE
jgi:hypothetical protein